MSLGEALGGISGEKFRGEKHDEKKVEKVVASAGYAYPGKEGFREESYAWSSTPSLILRMGGRIVYASRIPPRP